MLDGLRQGFARLHFGRARAEPMPSLHPSVAEVDAVTATADPVLRNPRITVAYGQLANVAGAVERHFRSRLDKRPLGRQMARLPGLSTDVLVSTIA
jgi:hypothetical protein